MAVIKRLLIVVGSDVVGVSSALYSFTADVVALPLPPSPPTCVGGSERTIGTNLFMMLSFLLFVVDVAIVRCCCCY